MCVPLFSGTVEFSKEKFTMRCPQEGTWFKKHADINHTSATYTQTYSGKTKGLYHCKYGTEEYYFYVKGKGEYKCKNDRWRWSSSLSFYPLRLLVFIFQGALAALRWPRKLSRRPLLWTWWGRRAWCWWSSGAPRRKARPPPKVRTERGHACVLLPNVQLSQSHFNQRGKYFYTRTMRVLSSVKIIIQIWCIVKDQPNQNIKYLKALQHSLAA